MNIDVLRTEEELEEYRVLGSRGIVFVQKKLDPTMTLNLDPFLYFSSDSELKEKIALLDLDPLAQYEVQHVL